MRMLWTALSTLPAAPPTCARPWIDRRGGPGARRRERVWSTNSPVPRDREVQTRCDGRRFRAHRASPGLACREPNGRRRAGGARAALAHTHGSVDTYPDTRGRAREPRAKAVETGPTPRPGRAREPLFCHVEALSRVLAWLLYSLCMSFRTCCSVELFIFVVRFTPRHTPVNALRSLTVLCGASAYYVHGCSTTPNGALLRALGGSDAHLQCTVRVIHRHGSTHCPTRSVLKVYFNTSLALIE